MQRKVLTCRLCAGWGKRFETVVEHTITRECKACEGVGTIPVTSGWRPFEADKDAVQAGREYNKCNRHNDCEAANLRAARMGLERAEHCHDEGCEDCLGK